MDAKQFIKIRTVVNALGAVVGICIQCPSQTTFAVFRS